MGIKTIAGVVLWILVTAGIGAVPDRGETGDREPLLLDFTEETGVELILLDVEAVDKDGRPLRGLGIDDFRLKIDGRVRQLYSVDDLCSCADPPNLQTPEVAGPYDSNEPTNAADRTAVPGIVPPPAEPMLYILFLSFGQLQQDGRAKALAEARRWIREVMQDDDQVQIVAWSMQAGLTELTPPTRQKDSLLEALDSAEKEPTLVDPFPELRSNRREELKICWESCIPPACGHCESMTKWFASEEYSQGKGSMQALQRTLYLLERIPGRKTLLYFYQNDVLFPIRMYPGAETPFIRDQIKALGQTAADANLSRTNIVAAYAGSSFSPYGINFGANLADMTGGSYSRDASLMQDVTDPAGRGCRCIYRIGVKPPKERNNPVHRAAVWVRGKRVSRSWRLRHLNRFDRWLREAQAVLLAPSKITDLPITSSMTPVSTDGKNWSIAVQVVVASDALVTLPTAAGNTGSWETGAMLYRNDGKKPMEFLARSALRVASLDADRQYIVHEYILKKTKPGNWQLGAFVRDKHASLFGGAAAELNLPRPGKAGLSTPVLFMTDRITLRTSLPVLHPRKEPPMTRTRATAVQSLAAGNTSIRTGDPIEIQSWICAPNDPAADMPLRFLSHHGKPVFRFKKIDRPAAGTCEPIVDEIDTGFLLPGEYTYHVRYGTLETELPLTLQ